MQTIKVFVRFKLVDKIAQAIHGFTVKEIEIITNDINSIKEKLYKQYGINEILEWRAELIAT